MNRLISVLCVPAVLACLALPARAADLPRKAPYYAPVAPVAIWSGFYIGANAGYGWATVSDPSGIADTDLNGFIGGGQIGYNWQFGSFVLGLEGDLQYSAQKKSESTAIGGTTFTAEAKIPWFGTARARIGYAFDTFMIYATGGAAWSNYKLTVSALGASISDDSSKTSWTAGAGVEWMFMPRWSAKLEYLYMDTGDTTLTLFGTTVDARVKNNIVRLGVNYHF